LPARKPCNSRGRGGFGGEPLVLRGHEYKVTSAAFSPDGTWIATGSRDNTARVWPLVQGLPELARLAWRRIAPVRGLSKEQKRRFFIEEAPPAAPTGSP
jgi:WD40 repeat protein